MEVMDGSAKNTKKEEIKSWRQDFACRVWSDVDTWEKVMKEV